MDNRTEYRDGVMSFRVDYLLDAMSDEDKLDFAERLSCEDAIIQHVADQITDRCTENGFHGGVMCSPDEHPILPLDKAARQVAKASGEIAQREIERLEKEVGHLGKQLQELREQAADFTRSRW